MTRQTGKHRQSAERVRVLVGSAVLAALILILQTTVGAITLGAFTVTFSLIPIVIGGALYGVGAGAALGTVFGLVVAGQVLAGAAGAFSAMMLAQNPVATIAVCIIKGAAAGLAAGLAASWLGQKNLTAGVVLAAIAAPVLNTGIFSIAMLTIYRGLLEGAAAGAGLLATLLIGFIGVNFLVETAVNVVLSPVIVHMIRAVRRSA